MELKASILPREEMVDTAGVFVPRVEEPRCHAAQPMPRK